MEQWRKFIQMSLFHRFPDAEITLSRSARQVQFHFLRKSPPFPTLMRGRIMGKAGRKVLEVSTDKRFSGFIQSGRTVAQNYEVSFQKTNSVSPLPLYPGYNCCEAADTQWRNKETVTKISLLSFYFIWIFFSFYLLLLHCQVWETSCLTMKNK